MTKPLRHDFWSSDLPDLPGAMLHGLIFATTGSLWAAVISAETLSVLFLLAACALLVMLVTGIVRPRTHEWRRVLHTDSTSTAHQFVDVLFALLGCQLVRAEVPGRTFFFVWGLVNLGLALLLSGLRFKYRDRAP